MKQLAKAIDFYQETDHLRSGLCPFDFASLTLLMIDAKPITQNRGPRRNVSTLDKMVSIVS